MDTDTNLMPPPGTNLMPPPNIAPPKRSTPKKEGAEKVEAAPEIKENEKEEAEVTEKKEEKGSEKGTEEEGEKGKEKEKDKEKWKEPEKVEMLYTPPEWSSTPKYPFFVDVLKNGTIVEKIDLSKKEHFLIGRIPICDITFDHPSVSRQHAVIQNRDTGALYIYDLGSTHRTVVNKRPIPPKVHYVIRIGDVIKIGQSSRQFIVGGPPEVEQEQREALERQRAEFLRKKLEDQVQIKTYTPLIDLFAKKDSSSTIASLRGDSASWGMDFDDDAVYAADNPEEEVFMGNEDDAEDYIKKGKKDAKNTAQQNKHYHKRQEDDEDDSGDDEFFDRTLHKNEGGPAKVETYESLLAKKEELTKQKEELTAELRATRSSGSSASSDQDSLDAFMNNNAESILGDKRKRIQAKIADIEKEQTRVERLIKLAAPALKPIAAPKKPEAKPAAKPAAEKPAETSAALPGGKTEKKKTSRPLQLLEADIPEEYRVKEEKGEEEEEEGEGKGKGKGKGKGPQVKAEGEKEEKREEKEENGEEKEKEEGEGEGKEEGEKGKSRNALKKERLREKHKQREEEEKKRQKLEEFESKYDAWVPPSAQTGDGRTKLNDLYGY